MEKINKSPVVIKQCDNNGVAYMSRVARKIKRVNNCEALRAVPGT